MHRRWRDDAEPERVAIDATSDGQRGEDRQQHEDQVVGQQVLERVIRRRRGFDAANDQHNKGADVGRDNAGNDSRQKCPPPIREPA